MARRWTWLTYEDGLRAIDRADGWPKSRKQLAAIVGSSAPTVGKAERSLLKHAPYSQNSALIIWCRMNGQGQNERYVEVLGYDPWKNKPEVKDG